MGLQLLQQACMRLGNRDTWCMPVSCHGGASPCAVKQQTLRMAYSCTDLLAVQRRYPDADMQKRRQLICVVLAFTGV